MFGETLSTNILYLNEEAGLAGERALPAAPLLSTRTK
jgi:hypothetical protein